MKLKIFQQIACSLAVALVGMAIGMTIMWNVRSASADVETPDGTLVYQMGTNATCEKAGSYGYYEDQTTGKKYWDKYGRDAVKAEADLVIPALGHNKDTMTFHAQENSTCGKEGHIDYWECNYCHQKFYDENGKSEIPAGAEIIEKKEHTFPLVHHDAKDATCEEGGCYEHWECVNCGECFQDEAGQIPFPGAKFGPKHTIEFVPGTPATCESTGMEAHYKCTQCQRLFKDAEGKIEVTAEDLVIEKLPHSGACWIEAEAPTCTKNGHPKYYQCTKGCGKYYTEDGHAYDTVPVLPKLGHDFADYVYDNAHRMSGEVRYYEDRNDAGFNKVEYFTQCKNTGCTERETKFVTGYAYLCEGEDEWADMFKVTAEYKEGEAQTNGKHAVVENLNVGQINSSNQAKFDLVIPNNYQADVTKIVCPDGVTYSVTSDGKYLHFVVDFTNANEFELKFDWEGNDTYEQIIHVIKKLA